MIGPLEIAIVVLILLVIFGARFLPALGRGAGKGIRIGSEKGKELATAASRKADEVDTRQLARTAGEHMRDARELRDTFKGDGNGGAKPKPAATEVAKPAGDEAGPSPSPSTSTGSAGAEPTGAAQAPEGAESSGADERTGSAAGES